MLLLVVMFVLLLMVGFQLIRGLFFRGGMGMGGWFGGWGRGAGWGDPGMRGGWGPEGGPHCGRPDRRGPGGPDGRGGGPGGPGVRA